MAMAKWRAINDVAESDSNGNDEYEECGSQPRLVAEAQVAIEDEATASKSRLRVRASHRSGSAIGCVKMVRMPNKTRKKLKIRLEFDIKTQG